MPITDEFHLKKLSGWMEYENQEIAVGHDALGNFGNVLDMFATDEKGRLYSPRLIEAKDERARYGEAKSFAGQQSAKKRAEARQREANRPSTGKQQKPSTNSTGGQPSESESESDIDKEKKQKPPTAGTTTSDKSAERSSDNSAKADMEPFVELWNGIAGVRKCTKITTTRASLFRTRLKDSFFKKNWRAAIQKAKSISWLAGGENGSGFRAGVEWFLKPDTVLKIIEGQHDDWYGGANGKPSKPPSAPQPSKWDDPNWHARQSKIHAAFDRKKRVAKEKGEPEPKPPQEYDAKWKHKGAKDSGVEDEKLPF